ncbi:MAG: sigma-70 family RNA polymerase sigma factor, partial [Gammaproteobacteria bacterium]
MAKDTDTELVRRVKQGDPRAFDLLFSRYQYRLVSLVSRYLRDAEDVQDVVQEAVIKAYRALPRFRGDSAFYTWLYRIAINTAKNHLAARVRRPAQADVTLEDAEQFDSADALRDVESPEAALARDQLEAEIRAAIADLPEDQ